MKQKKREENIQARKDLKKNKGKKVPKKGGNKARMDKNKNKNKGRPGFEGGSGMKSNAGKPTGKK